ncbi:MAG: hypothetical protein L7F78_04255 [Syntrophales bacterium LBB04]|nr:hypothetical protein [Syntrophales bacterium LBB04]
MQPQVISDLGIAVLLYRLSHAGIPLMRRSANSSSPRMLCARVNGARVFYA